MRPISSGISVKLLSRSENKVIAVQLPIWNYKKLLILISFFLFLNIFLISLLIQKSI